MDLQIDIQWVLAWSVRIPSSYRLKMLEIACQLARKVTKLPLHLCRVVFHQGKWFMIINIPEFSSIKQTKNAKEMTCLCRKQDDLPVKWVQDDMPWRAPRPVVRSRSVKVSTVEVGTCWSLFIISRPLDGRQAKTHQTPIILFEIWRNRCKYHTSNREKSILIYMLLHVLLLSDIFLAGHVYSSCWWSLVAHCRRSHSFRLYIISSFVKLIVFCKCYLYTVSTRSSS